MRIALALSFLCVLSSVSIHAQDVAGPSSAAFDAKTSWPAEVPGFVAPKSNEHPRLFFRKADLQQIRQRAKTPEGKAIVARLRFLLDGGGGDTMPTEFNPSKESGKDGSGAFHDKAPMGKTYTLWHGAGFGMLYQLTGDRKYADLGRQCVEKALDGQRDRDNRYSFVKPIGALRGGPSLGAIAMAYDLNFDGWDPEFRGKVARAIVNYNEGKNLSLDELARGSRHGPHSNHWGCQIGGAALALLAVRGDDGVDEARIRGLLDDNARCIIRNVTEGFGDGGYFNEHAGPGQISSDTAYIPGVQAWRVAGGKDFVTPRPNIPMISLIRVYELKSKPGGGYHYPLRHSSSYGTPAFERNGLSRGGQMVQGLAAVRPEHRAAMLWTFNNILEPDAAGRSYDTLSPYPHRAALALVNWPIGEPEKNPAEVLPRVAHDSIKNYVVFRNRWKDADDIVITGLWGARNDGVERVMVWACGQTWEWSVCAKSKERSRVTGVRKDGSRVITAQGVSLAVDFSGTSGADALIVMTGPGAGDGKSPASPKVSAGKLSAGKSTYAYLTLSATGKHPEARADGDSITVGNQRVSLRDGALVIEK